jgi:alpha,alpha-trehalase
MQFSGLFNDSKTFVDMPLKHDPEDIIDDFNSISDYNRQSLQAFLERNFDEAGSNVVQWTPNDYLEIPPFLDNIHDHTLRSFAIQINSLWKLLGRKVSDDVYQNPRRHTLLRLKSPHMMVPGGRFREFCKQITL